MPRTSSWRAIWTLHRRHHPLAAALLPVCGGDAHSARTELQWLRERARAVAAADAARRIGARSSRPRPPPSSPSPTIVGAVRGSVRRSRRSRSSINSNCNCSGISYTSSSTGAGAITARNASARPCHSSAIDSLRQWQWKRRRALRQQSRHSQQQQQRRQEDLLLQRYCAMRRQGRPLQYIIGDQPFGDVDILCRRGVLIPRVETEAYTIHLANILIKQQQQQQQRRHHEQQRAQGQQEHLPYRPPQQAAAEGRGGPVGETRGGGLRILDICSGSGCIALALYARLWPHIQRARSDHGGGGGGGGDRGGLRVLGVDASAAAVRLARRNLRWNVARGKLPRDALRDVRFVRADVLGDEDWLWDDDGGSKDNREGGGREGDGAGYGWNIVVANPPYISRADFVRRTARSVRNWEPIEALVPSLPSSLPPPSPPPPPPPPLLSLSPTTAPKPPASLAAAPAPTIATARAAAAAAAAAVAVATPQTANPPLYSAGYNFEKDTGRDGGSSSSTSASNGNNSDGGDREDDTDGDTFYPRLLAIARRVGAHTCLFEVSDAAQARRVAHMAAFSAAMCTAAATNAAGNATSAADATAAAAAAAAKTVASGGSSGSANDRGAGFCVAASNSESGRRCRVEIWRDWPDLPNDDDTDEDHGVLAQSPRLPSISSFPVAPPPSAPPSSASSSLLSPCSSASPPPTIFSGPVRKVTTPLPPPFPFRGQGNARSVFMQCF